MAYQKVALITGGGSGIGKVCATALASAGFAVVLAGRRKEPLAEVADQIIDSGGRALPIPADVSDPVSVAALFAETECAFGRLDLLFNNAGTYAPAVEIEDFSYPHWLSILDINLTGPFLCTQHAFKLMKAQNPRGGRIINNGSVSAHSPRPLSAPYTATKHAITGLTKATALDGRAYNIACGQIDIGNAATDMTLEMAGGIRQADGSIKSEPVIDPKHVADALIFMAGLPLDANVPNLTVMATKMPFIGRG